jgi:hypothetical protein
LRGGGQVPQQNSDASAAGNAFPPTQLAAPQNRLKGATFAAKLCICRMNKQICAKKVTFMSHSRL